MHINLEVRGLVGRKLPRQKHPCCSRGNQQPPFRRMMDSGLIGTRRGPTHSQDLSDKGAARAEDAQGTPNQSHISPTLQVYEDELAPPSESKNNYLAEM
jgi:hypothetical protein